MATSQIRSSNERSDSKDMEKSFDKKGSKHLEAFEIPRSISPTFYDQLLQSKIPKVYKDSQVISVFWRFWNLRS